MLLFLLWNEMRAAHFCVNICILCAITQIFIHLLLFYFYCHLLIWIDISFCLYHRHFAVRFAFFFFFLYLISSSSSINQQSTTEKKKSLFFCIHCNNNNWNLLKTLKHPKHLRKKKKHCTSTFFVNTIKLQVCFFFIIFLPLIFLYLTQNGM